MDVQNRPRQAEEDDSKIKALMAQGKYNLLREALMAKGKYIQEVQRKKRGIYSNTLDAIHDLGLQLHDKGDLATAAPLLREALKVRRKTLGSRHPDTLLSIHNLGALLHDKGDLAAAEPLLREALEGQRETLGDRHSSTLVSILNLGDLLKAKSDLAAAESETLLREAN